MEISWFDQRGEFSGEIGHGKKINITEKGGKQKIGRALIAQAPRELKKNSIGGKVKVYLGRYRPVEQRLKLRGGRGM